MSKEYYKFSCLLKGHTQDVRALATFNDGTIVSTSRDQTACVWKTNSSGKDYSLQSVLLGHSNFVCSVCVINPSHLFPKGYIITGGNDSYICIYELDHTEPLHKIKAHQNNVCNLRTSHEEGMFLSSSWDCTGSLWSIKDLSKPLATFVAHTAAVWCILDLANGAIVSGSADKKILVWQRNGAVLHTLEGHTDCIRDFAAVGDSEFLSCANDATVRHWNAASGVCLATYSRHSNYIYSIVYAPNISRIATAGEDYCIKVWHNEDLEQTINLPAQSIWCVRFLPNGDIVAGANDGISRIFTKDPDRYADPHTMAAFQKEVDSAMSTASSNIGGIHVNNLPSVEALQQPGTKDGQVKMIREGNSGMAYKWSQSKGQWEKVGEVTGGSGGTNATSGKQLYNGIEYDYVFPVDIEDGAPPLKLPYNRNQDPWEVAQKFIHDNGLAQVFLEQIANFIIKNSNATPVLNTGGQYIDPFTGGSRYVPSSQVDKSNHSSNISSKVSYIPQTNYLRLEQANLSAILEKLKHFNSKNNDSSHHVLDNDLEKVMELVQGELSVEHAIEAIGILKCLLNWPNDTVFPVLDITRLAILHQEANNQLCKDELMNVINRHIKADALLANQMLTFRLLANMFVCPKGEALGLQTKEEILQALLSLSSLGNKYNQIAISTYLLNLVVALNKQNNLGKRKTMEAILDVLPKLNDQEATFRVLVAMGSLLSAVTITEEERKELVEAVRNSATAFNVLLTIPENATGQNAHSKLVDCSKHIIDLIV